jgi:hypothetical protein
VAATNSECYILLYDACNVTALESHNAENENCAGAIISNRQNISSQGTYLEVLHLVFSGGKGEGHFMASVSRKRGEVGI